MVEPRPDEIAKSIPRLPPLSESLSPAANARIAAILRAEVFAGRLGARAALAVIQAVRAIPGAVVAANIAIRTVRRLNDVPCSAGMNATAASVIHAILEEDRARRMPNRVFPRRSRARVSIIDEAAHG